jgi:hypothetical protein
VTVAFVTAASYNSSCKIAQHMGLFSETGRMPELHYVIEVVRKMEREETARNTF